MSMRTPWCARDFSQARRAAVGWRLLGGGWLIVRGEGISEEGQGAGPGVFGGGGVGPAQVAVAQEGVAGARVDHYLERLAEAGEGLADALGVGEGDELVLIAEEEEHGRVDSVAGLEQRIVVAGAEARGVEGREGL